VVEKKNKSLQKGKGGKKAGGFCVSFSFICGPHISGCVVWSMRIEENRKNKILDVVGIG